MFIDLDRFKVVNDSLGHQAGDLLLKEAADRIAQCLRASDLLFRMGGDEFMVILPEIASPEFAAHVAQRVIGAVGKPVSIYEHELTVGATVGIAVFPDDGTQADALVKNADAAMYSAKERGRGTHAFYRHEMNERALQRLGLEAGLRKAFAAGEFLLHYQPRLDAARRRIVAVEALLRWDRPGCGIVPPGEFIDVLEDIGLMPIVGEWVLRSACAQLKQWQEQGLPPLHVSVNVSAKQFHSPSFTAMVARVISEVGTAPGAVELELAESMLITHPQEAAGTVAALRRLGVRVSIDDFGTGHSSLNYLRHLVADILKIDRSFVSEVPQSDRHRAIVTAITQLARSLGMTVVAEGVETADQASFLSGICCDELQGFLFSKPVPAERFAAMLKASSGRALESGAAAGPISGEHPKARAQDLAPA
jgi:diguanylate cyclase (GGDEF)-like protein